MSLVKVNSFLLILVSLLAVLQESSTASLPTKAGKITILPKVTVDIINNLPLPTLLTIHCKSKDDDLGIHVVQPLQRYSFQFRVNLFGSTLFFCGASWQGGHVEFDIFNAKRDNDRCDTYCMWEAREDAMVGFRQDNDINEDISFPWKH
ncbi:S-protein homolog 5-like [Punica granatum]|uniref:S-protein homolog n=2 Tax=Punica granatum TaxID=22663 RepID=A0A218WM85_PUNGR|nr:S-protein homolog 5-like [Punica granatum]OWM73905.1 hypothetical protein CDL15_Pgr018965 [Punica granatum]PKI40548.1 hypothetical protein CRG98_039063 [Punica granatum]